MELQERLQEPIFWLLQVGILIATMYGFYNWGYSQGESDTWLYKEVEVYCRLT